MLLQQLEQLEMLPIKHFAFFKQLWRINNNLWDSVSIYLEQQSLNLTSLLMLQHSTRAAYFHALLLICDTGTQEQNIVMLRGRDFMDCNHEIITVNLSQLKFNPHTQQCKWASCGTVHYKSSGWKLNSIIIFYTSYPTRHSLFITVIIKSEYYQVEYLPFLPLKYGSHEVVWNYYIQFHPITFCWCKSIVIGHCIVHRPLAFVLNKLILTHRKCYCSTECVIRCFAHCIRDIVWLNTFNKQLYVKSFASPGFSLYVNSWTMQLDSVSFIPVWH